MVVVVESVEKGEEADEDSERGDYDRMFIIHYSSIVLQ